MADRSRPTAARTRPIALSVLPGTPLVEAGLWALLRGCGARVAPAPLGADTEVVVGIVTPAAGSPLPPAVDKPLVVIVSDWATALLVSDRGAVAVPLATSGAQLLAVIEMARDAAAPGVAGPHPAARPASPANPASPLSHREVEVVTGICAGLTNPQIAAVLFLSDNSIKTYVRTAYRKMGVTGRTDAVRWGLSHGYGRPGGGS